MSTTRRKFSNEFKTKVVLESLKERETLEWLAKKYELLPTQISAWKTQALQNFGQVFTSDKPEKKENAVDIDKLYSQIDQLKVENDFLKKKLQWEAQKKEKRWLILKVQLCLWAPSLICSPSPAAVFITLSKERAKKIYKHSVCLMSSISRHLFTVFCHSKPYWLDWAIKSTANGFGVW